MVALLCVKPHTQFCALPLRFRSWMRWRVVCERKAKAYKLQLKTDFFSYSFSFRKLTPLQRNMYITQRQRLFYLFCIPFLFVAMFCLWVQAYVARFPVYLYAISKIIIGVTDVLDTAISTSSTLPFENCCWEACQRRFANTKMCVCAPVVTTGDDDDDGRSSTSSSDNVSYECVCAAGR